VAEVPYQFRWATLPQATPSKKLVRSLNASMRQLSNDFEARLQFADSHPRDVVVAPTFSANPIFTAGVSISGTTKVTLAQDKFTGTDTAVLTGHTPDLGFTSWDTDFPDSITIVGNRAKATGTESYLANVQYIAYPMLTDDNFDAYVDIVPALVNCQPGLWFRCDNTASFHDGIECHLLPNGSETSVNLYVKRYDNTAVAETFTVATALNLGALFTIGIRLGVSVAAAVVTVWTEPYAGGTRTTRGTATLVTTLVDGLHKRFGLHRLHTGAELGTTWDNLTVLASGSLIVSRGVSLLIGDLAVQGATTLAGALTVAGAITLSGAVSITGAATLTGTVSETAASADQVRIGVAGGTPRILLEDGASATIWEIDNNAGVMRFFNPAAAKMQLTTAALSPATTGLLTLGTPSLPWGATYVGALTAASAILTSPLGTAYGGTGAASFDAATLYSGGATVGTLPKIGAAHTLVDSLLSESGSVVTLNGSLSLVGGTIGRISSGTDDSDWTVSRYAANTTAAAIVLRKSYGAVGSEAYPIAFMSLGALVWQGWDEAIGDFVSPGGQSPAYIFAAAWNAWTASDHSTYLEFALTPVGTVTPVRVVYLQYDGTWAPSSGRGNVPDLGTTGLPWRTGYFGTSVISPIFSGPVLRSNSATDLLLQYNTTTGARLGASGFAINATSVEARLDVYETTALGGTLGNSQLIWQHRSAGGSGGNTIRNRHWAYRDATGTTWTTWRLHDALSVDGSFVTPGTDTRCFWERDPNNDIQAWGTGATAYFTLTSTLATFAGAVRTAAPTTGTAANWKLGSRVAATVALDTTQYVELDVGGTLYKIGVVT